MRQPDWNGEVDAGWYRRTVGHRIEKWSNRLLGLLLGAIGLLAIFLSLSSEGFTLASHWPGLLAGFVLLFLSRLCFKARKAVLADIGEETDFRSPRQPGK